MIPNKKSRTGTQISIMEKKIAVIFGDGIGPEVTQQSIKVLNAVGQRFGHVFHYTEAIMGADAIDKTGNPLPDETIATCLNSDAILFGAIGHPKYDNDPTAKVRPEQGLLKLRKELQLFANIRPITTYQALHHLSPLKSKQLKGIDFVIFRELTGGIYFGKKELSADQTYATDECSYGKNEIERVSHLAFQYARKRKRRLTLVDKANVLETSRLWRKVVQEIATQYSDVTVDYMFVDNAAMQIILHPAQFDVILTENMFGDILTDEAAVISGSLGLLPSASVGNKISLYEPIHGSFPEAAGKGIANPVGAILSAAMMLEYSFGMKKESLMIQKAVEESLNKGIVTHELNNENYYSTSEVGDVIRSLIGQNIIEQV